MLIEALIALAVLAVGVVGVAGLINLVRNGNRRLAFQTKSLEVYAAFAAQVRNAGCDATEQGQVLAARTDPGLAPGDHDVAVNGSAIELVGQRMDMIPPVRVRYASVAAAFPADYVGPPAYDITVEIREITYDAARDAAQDGFWVRRFPIRKVCNIRVDDQGRGEFY